MDHGSQFGKVMPYLASDVPHWKIFTQRIIAAAHKAAKVFGLTSGNYSPSVK